MPNRLSQESSPYLKQHENNPVDWYPWGDEALAKARAEDKPIILSVGYSACHWCHVMEHESFEDAEISGLMNAHFVSIKVDREERPDLDQIYQNVAQLMTRSGGWPLTVFLTPDLKPFFGGTYFPPDDRYGRPGFGRVLKSLSEAYKNDRASVAENATRLTEAIGKLEGASDGTSQQANERPTPESLRKIMDGIVSNVDWRYGGFGGAPKFPNPMLLTYLWRYGCASGIGMAQEAVTVALAKMSCGGIFDQLGGGFHRYSVDHSWSVPHFEKMLYDNGLLLKLYSEVVLTDAIDAKNKALFVRTIKETTEYLLREMRSPQGAFYATQDADSEGEEGKFFVWNRDSIEAVLQNKEDTDLACRVFGVTDHGNFEESGQTVLFRSEDVTSESETRKLEEIRAKLFNARSKRIAPARDEKVLAAWNGLAISGLAWAAEALEHAGEKGLAAEAKKASVAAMNFVQEKMSRENGRLWSVYKDEKARFNAYLDDYAFLAMGALDLARFETAQAQTQAWIDQARIWIETVNTHFPDPQNGGYFFTSDDHEALIQRPKTLYDQAIPSGHALTLECLLALAEITGDATFEKMADEQLYRSYPAAVRQPFGMGELANAALLAFLGPITVAGDDAAEACRHPHVFQKPKTSAASGLLVCHHKTCSLPLTSVEAARTEWKKKFSIKGGA